MTATPVALDNGVWLRNLHRWSAHLMVFGSFLPALLLGVAFANLFSGIPVDKEGVMHGNLLTLLNPYGLAGGVFFVAAFLHHGALWLAVKSEGSIQNRARALALKLWVAALVVSVVFLAMTWFYTSLWQNLLTRPAFLALPALAHRLVLANQLDSTGRAREEAERIITDILGRVPVPG